MPLVFAEGLSLQYGGKVIFEDESIAIEAGDRLGIIGANGTGKSSLFRILTGRAQPDGGRVNRSKGCRLGYLEQEMPDPGAGQLLDSLLQAAPGRGVIEDRIRENEQALESTTDPEVQVALSDVLSDLHGVLTELDQKFAKHEAERILSGLGFETTDFGRPLREFSGGWRMRAELARLLFEQPDLLFLDEPTNHLDMPSVEWLSRFLQGFKQALVLISHDREFLNRHIKRVASLEVEGLRLYRGNYDQYRVQREEELELLENKADRDDRKKKELEAFVERFRAKATKARQAQSRMRMIEKLEEQVVELPRARRVISIAFKPTVRSGDVVISAAGLSYGYGTKPLFEKLSVSARRGDRIAIVGRNGAGKTTLLKLLAGELSPDGGEVKLGQNVTPSYFAQHHADVLNGNNNVLEEVWRAAPDLSQTEARAICGAFLFSGDEVEKPVSVLSGGEKARVALGRMLASPGNLLLLDEPTNHLDTESASRLTDSLSNYDGTLLFVSHNLDFARRLSNKVWDVHDGVVEVYPGSLADYLERLKDLNESAESQTAKSRPSDGKVTRKEAYKEKRDREAEERKKLSQVKKKLADAEAKIAALETEQATLETELANPTTHQDPERAKSLGRRYTEVKSSLEAEMIRWEQLSVELEVT